MRPPDSEVKQAVLQWLDRAAKDLRACLIVLDNDASLAGVAAFHAQQAAEKYLKALLTWRQIAFAKTHDIGLLLELLGREDPSIANDLREAIVLTDYAVDARYPGDVPDIPSDEARRLLELAKQVEHEVIDRLPPDLRP